MEIRIGMINTAREIGLETSQSLAEVEALVSNALTGSDPLLKLSDDKGKVYLIAAGNIAFVEVASANTDGSRLLRVRPSRPGTHTGHFPQTFRSEKSTCFRGCRSVPNRHLCTRDSCPRGLLSHHGIA